MMKHGIVQLATANNLKTFVEERLTHMLNTRMWKYLLYCGYIDVLQELMKNYDRNYHKSEEKPFAFLIPFITLWNTLHSVKMADKFPLKPSNFNLTTGLPSESFTTCLPPWGDT